MFLDGTLRRQRNLPRKIVELHDAATAIGRHDRATASRQRWDAEMQMRWIDPILDRYRAHTGVGCDAEALFGPLLAASSDLYGADIPLVGDGRTGCSTDGSDGEARCLPLMRIDDLVREWLSTVTPRSPASPWAQTPDTVADPISRGAHLAARSVVASYCRTVDLDPRFIPIAVVCNAAELAMRDNRTRPSSDPGVMELLVATSGELFDATWPPSTRSGPRRVGIVSPFGLSDTGHGAPAAIRGTVDALALHNDVEIVTSSSDEAEADAPPPRHPWSGVVRQPLSPRNRRLHLLAGMIRGRPPWAIEWTSADLTDQIVSLVDRSDVTHIEFVVMADQIPRGHRARNPIIVIDHDPPVVGARLQLRRDPWSLKPFRLLELQAWARTQRRVGKVATVVVVFAPEDQRIVHRFVRTTPVIVAPLTIELPLRALDPIGSGPPTLAFFGSYRRTPNLQALQRLVERVMPLVWVQRPDARLRAIGPEPPQFAIGGDERITATGYVEDLSEALDDVALVVAPIALGRGMRIKVLEALALGKAVITTPRGAAGFPPAARNCMVVVEKDADVAAAVVDLLDDPERRGRLATDGRRWAEEWLAVEQAAARYRELHDLVDALRAGESA